MYIFLKVRICIERVYNILHIYDMQVFRQKTCTDENCIWLCCRKDAILLLEHSWKLDYIDFLSKGKNITLFDMISCRSFSIFITLHIIFKTMCLLCIQNTFVFKLANCICMQNKHGLKLASPYTYLCNEAARCKKFQNSEQFQKKNQKNSTWLKS